MKKAVLLSFFLVLLFATTASAAPTVILNGQQLTFDVPPVIQDGSTLVPLRAIFEPLGAYVRWEPQTKTVTVYKDNNEIKLVIDRVDAYVNNSMVTLSTPARSIDGRTMVPLRFVSTALGANVSWEPNSQTITIETASGTGITPVPSGQTKVHYINVGQADSIYIQLPEHNDILIDGGGKLDGLKVVDYLRAQGVDDLELVIATHPHEDHIGGLQPVLVAFKVEKVIDSGCPYNTTNTEIFKEKAKAEGCTWETDSHQIMSFGGNFLEILTGDESWDEVNDYSVVCRLDTGNIEFLFTGDASGPSEEALNGNLDAEILKVGYHGDQTSSSTAFLDKVNPKVAIISVGKGNGYSHPDGGMVSRLTASGARVYRTDEDGTIVVTTDGTTFNVNCTH